MYKSARGITASKPTLNSIGFSESYLIQLRQKLLEKLGGAGMPDVFVVAAVVMCSASVALRGDDILMDTLPDICVFPMLSDCL